MDPKAPSNNVPAAPDADFAATGPWIRTGNRVLAGLVVGCLLFGLVSISGAVVATGVVNVESNYKTVQHLDGGIVAKILVRNGDRVQEGDVVVKLDDTQVRANHSVAVAKMNDLLVQQAHPSRVATLSAEKRAQAQTEAAGVNAAYLRLSAVRCSR